MPFPSDPTKIVLRNNFYPNGLTAEKVYNYYIKNKRRIIKECNNRPVLLFNSFKENTPLIIRRNLPTGPIILTNDNYESIITGYTISISVETAYNGDKVNEKIIDIDPIGTIKENELKSCVFDILNFYKNFKCTVTNSSKGYHIRVHINPTPRKVILQIMTSELTSEFGNKYYINDKSRTILSGINLDLVAMQSKGSITVPYALTREGLICSPIKNVTSFKRFKQVVR